MAGLRGMRALQKWAQVRTDGYKDVHVCDMSKSWRNGLAFCAIIHRYRPDLIDFDALSKENVYENNSLAFEVAQVELGVPALLDAEDMVALEVPDKLSITTYVAQLYNYFKDMIPVGGPDVKAPIKRHSAAPSSPLQSPKRITFDKKSKQQPSSDKKSSTLSDRCALCDGKVYLLERQIVDGHSYHRTCWKDSNPSPAAHGGYPLSPSHRQKKETPAFSFDVPHSKEHAHSEPPKHTKIEKEKSTEDHKHKFRLHLGNHKKHDLGKDTTKTPVGKTKEISSHEEGLPSKFRKTEDKLADKSAKKGGLKTGEYGRKLLFKKDATPDVKSAISMFQDKEQETPGKAAVTASPVLRRTENKGDNRKMDLGKSDSNKSDDFDLDSLVEANSEALSVSKTSANHKPRPVSLGVQKRTGPLGKAGNDKKDLTSPGKTMDLFISNVSRSSIRKEKAQSADLEHLKQTGVRHSFLDKLESTPRKNESDSPLKKTNVTPGYDSRGDSGDKVEKSKDIQERDIFKAYKEKYGTPTKETDASKKQIPEVRKTDVVIPSKLHETPCKETKEETPADNALSQSKDSNSVKKGLYGDRYFEEDWQLKLSAKIRGLSKGVKEESASEEKQEESMDQTASLHVDVTEEEEISESPSSSPTSQSSSEEKMEEQVETTTLNEGVESRENFKPAPRSATHDNISEKSEKTELPPKASSLENLDKTPQKEKKYGVDDKHNELKSSSVEDLLAARRRRRENLAASSVESLDSQGTPKASNICAVCNDRVFRSERVQINGAVFHKKCQDKQPEVKSVPTEATTKRTTDRTSRSSSESLNDVKEARNTEPNSVPDRKHSEKSLGSSAESLNDAKSVEKGAAIDTSSVIRRKKELNSEISRPDSEKTPTRAIKSEIILTDQSNLKGSGVEFDGEFKRPFPKPRIKSIDNERVNGTSNDKQVHEKTAYIPLKEKNSKELEVKQERKYGWRNSKENTEYKVQDSPTFALKTNEKRSSWDEKEKQQKSRLGAKEDSNVPEWQLEAQKRQARKFVDPEKSWLTKTPEKFKQETVNSVSKISNKTDVAKKWERDEKVDKGKPERSTLRQTQEEYPDELNPFGTTDDEKQLAKEIQAKNDNSSNIYNENNKAGLSRRTKVKSYNPFESDEDDVPESPLKSSPVETKKKKGESLNPFDTSDEDEDAGELSGWQKEAERRRIARESQSEEDWLRGRSVSSSDSETKGRGTRPVDNGVSEMPPPKPPRSNAGTLEPESKLDWQKEAEKRQEARGGVYESPSRKVIHPKDDDNEEEEKHIAPSSRGLKKVVPDRPFHFDSTSTDQGRSSSTFSESEGVDSPRQQGGARKKRLAPQPPKDTPPLSPSPTPSPTPSPGIVSSPEKELDLSNTHPRYKKRNAPSRPIAPKRKICSGERRLSTTEIKHELDVLDKEQTELEVEGRELENKIRGSGSQGEDDDELLSQWFELVNKKNRMVRRESEIIYISTTSTSDDEASNSHSGSLDGDSNAKIDSSNSSNNGDNKSDKKSDSSEEYATASDHKGSGSAASDDDEEEDYLDDDDVFEEPVSNSRLQALEDRQADIEYDLRCIMEKQEHVKTDSDKQKEEELLAELVQVVEERSRVVDTMEEDRIRAEEEDKEIEVVLSEKGLNTGIPEKEKDKKKKEKKDKKGKKGKKK
ncbi:uncharacterized protein DDB_G0284459 isoform X1 [Lingula anatina]|uniref:Uncharacterized protein DDB_G0284459 isoform X1 n=1 Tax=Lingula anatina TaxID=7574 RepID=A0A1S3I6P4_LINAN|nr:uncharacterized protein DDB_G0284459 isoform X1 [Lingula anatina]XP_013393039.1 uncharacterized protein DDB_G0284459 isoform X1 [Lingula anatina]|eukprot:XP_013393038.1 uncharacterized protein DDB_G0284459 isoform X1 [Lingula anatina]